jgi:putative NADPH-quinone reductase
MNIYSILVHPNSQSLNANMFKLANKLFSQQGHIVNTLNLFDVNDEMNTTSKALYKSTAPLLDRRYESAFHYNYIRSAEAHSNIFADVEITKLKKADLLYIQTPIMVWNIPSILKLYIELVFLPDLVFKTDKMWADNFKHEGLLEGKRVFVSFVMGASKKYCEHIMGDVSYMTRPVESMFKLAGYKWLEPCLTWGTTRTYVDKCDNYLTDFEQHVATVINNSAAPN